MKDRSGSMPVTVREIFFIKSASVASPKGGVSIGVARLIC